MQSRPYTFLLMALTTLLPVRAQAEPRALEKLPGKETVLINKEVQGGLGRERYTIEYAPGESVIGNIFNPDTGETAFTVCEDQGLYGPGGDDIVLYCRTKTPNDAEFIDVSFPPKPPTLLPKSFLGVGTEVLLPFDRGYTPEESFQKVVDCETLAARVPKIITRLLGDCYASLEGPGHTTYARTPDYEFCRANGRERHRALYDQLADAGCLTQKPRVPYARDFTDETYAVLADAYQAADERARALDRWIYNGDGTATDTTTGQQWELKTDDGSIHDKDNVYSWSASGTAPDGTAFVQFIGTLNGSADGVCFAGHCDWRVPTDDELRGTRDDSVPGREYGAPCTTLEGPLPARSAVPAFYWTSSVYEDDPTLAYNVYFYEGFGSAAPKSARSYVRAVRGDSRPFVSQ